MDHVSHPPFEALIPFAHTFKPSKHQPTWAIALPSHPCLSHQNFTPRPPPSSHRSFGPPYAKQHSLPQTLSTTRDLLVLLIITHYDSPHQLICAALCPQTKETLTLRATSFGSKCELPDKFIKKVADSGVADRVLSFASFKQNKEMKKSDGSKRTRITGAHRS